MNNYDQKFMDYAQGMSTLATDLRRPIGCVIVNDELIIGHGSNQANIRWSWLIKLHKKYCLRKIFKTPKNKMYWFCPGCAVNSNHAEIRAINDAIKNGFNKNMFAKMYIYGHTYCCAKCMESINKFNIDVVFNE